MPSENQIVKPSFNIINENVSGAIPNLFMYVGRQGIAIAYLDRKSYTFNALQIFYFDKRITDKQLAEQINIILNAENLQQKYFNKIFTIWCFNETILVPPQYFDAVHSKEMLQLVHGDAAPVATQNEFIITHNLYNVYSVPDEVKNIFSNRFPLCLQSHQNSLIINFEKSSKDLLYCNFNPYSFDVFLKKDGQLQAIQSFEFDIATDAVFHLLNICHSFDVSAEQVTLCVSGTIDADSVLYNELNKYFLNITFLNLPANFNYAGQMKNYPEHYFSHFFALAACVL